MTRLDSAIRRLTAQRDLLDWAAGEIDPGGLVLELGLGNGRTYDHLRDRLPGREIYVFERSPAAHPSCTPAERLHDRRRYLRHAPGFHPALRAWLRGLIHVDIGTGDEDRNGALALRVSPLLEALLQPGGLLLADRAFALPHCADISVDRDVPEGRYFVYRRERVPTAVTA